MVNQNGKQAAIEERVFIAWEYITCPKCSGASCGDCGGGKVLVSVPAGDVVRYQLEQMIKSGELKDLLGRLGAWFVW